jgi:hypothetical protein
MLVASIGGPIQVVIAEQLTQIDIQLNGQIVYSTQTDTILSLQWQRTDTYLDNDATLAVSEIQSQIPSANFARIDVRIRLSGSTAWADPALLNEYQAAVDKLQAAGFNVIIRIRVPDQVNIDPPDKTTFFSTYAEACVYWTDFCIANNIDYFCMGTEFTTLESVANVAGWNSVISTIRSNYAGKIFYNTNYWYQETGTIDSLEQKLAQTWWQNLDYICVSTYWDIAPSEDATVSEMVAAWSDCFWWHEDVVADLQLLSDTHGVPLILNTGLASQNGAAMHPWKFDWDTVDVDVEEQRRWFEAFFQVFHDEPFVEGYMIDGAFFTAYNKNPNNNEFTTQNKPAAATIEAWYNLMESVIP